MTTNPSNIFVVLLQFVHVAVWGLDSQQGSYKFQVFRRISEHLAAFAEKLILISDAKTCTRSKQKFNSMLVITYYFMSLIGVLWMRKNRFRHHQVFYRRLLHASKVPYNIHSDWVRCEMGKWMLYSWWSPMSTFEYVGKTNRLFQDRVAEHVKGMHFPV